MAFTEIEADTIPPVYNRPGIPVGRFNPRRALLAEFDPGSIVMASQARLRQARQAGVAYRKP
jgi:hypothetical protein